MESIVPDFLKDYLQELLQRFSEIQEVWLFGSQVNNTASKDSDWDVLLFANLEVLGSFENNISLKRMQVDLFIVYDGKRFKQPWVSLDKSLKQRTKKGNLEDWEFARISDSVAVYWGTKENAEFIEKKMFRIWDKQKGWSQN